MRNLRILNTVLSIQYFLHCDGGYVLLKYIYIYITKKHHPCLLVLATGSSDGSSTYCPLVCINFIY